MSHWFDGDTYNHLRDQARLNRQIGLVWTFMCDGRWHTLNEIAAYVRGSEAAISARLRDLRKERFGSHRIEAEFVRRGLWRYRLLPPPRPRHQLKGEA